jgi:hypothetical protein
MNQPGSLKNPSDEAIEMTYVCLAEVEVLVDRLSDNKNSWFDRGNLNTLLILTQYLNLNRLKAVLADVGELELKHGVGPERSQRIRSALNVDKLQLYYGLDTGWSSHSRKMEDAA